MDFVGRGSERSDFAGQSGFRTPSFRWGSHDGVNDGVNRSEVGLVSCRPVAQKGEEIWGNPRLLPLQIDAEHLKGYLKG